ncbi:metal ABC transporter permease [Campylobacter sp. RM12640]|uniref:metal ABC transporter permease n=2 Tax=Campylobacter TaxID=194 RepID=UPI001BD9A50E|nr:metal ABC transporter permease [Campylobacter sp. 2018MI01]MBZ7981480.1 metal ABC transporter permease [Campylobacter sp. RM12640]MBZ7989095.1 metal ABC transporter permease [Campylobacter sp. RM12635]
MMEYLNYNFIQNAILAAVLVSIACGIIGALVLTNRLVAMVGGISHAAYGGLGISLYFGVSTMLSTLTFVIACAVLIAYLSRNYKNQDAVIGVVWAFGMSVGILLSDLSPNSNSIVFSYLFGAILAVELSDIYIMLSADIAFIIMAFVFYRQLIGVSVDSEFCKANGVNANLIYYMLIIAAAICIVISLRVVGMVLILALLCIPSYISSMFCTKLSSMMIISVLLSLFFCLGGLILSIAYELSSGACIILLACFCFMIAYVLSFIVKKRI